MAQSVTAPKSDTVKAVRKPRQSAKSATPGPGHNGPEPLTEEEQEALQLHHELKVRAQMKKADVAKAAYDLEKNEVNALVKMACAEMNVLAGDFRDYLADKNLDAVEYRKKATARALLRKRGGMPDVNGQYTLELPTQADTVTDKQMAYDDGFRAGKRADDPLPVPQHISPIFHGDWGAGWSDGQADNVLKLGIAAKVLERLAKPAPAPAAALDPDAPLDTDALDDEARKLRRSGFMDTTPTANEQAT